MNSDLQSNRLTATGYVFQGPGRIYVMVIHSQNAGVVTFRDGGPTGSVKIEIAFGSNANYTVPLNGQGVRFERDIYMSATAVDSITIFWG